MFVYCLNNPVNNCDATGAASKIIFGDTFDVLDAPWEDAGGGGSRPKIYLKYTGPASFAVIEASVSNDSGLSKTGTILGGEFDALSFNYNSFTFLSFDLSAVSIDFAGENWELSLFDLGNVSAEVGFYGWIPYAGAMVSVWNPSFSYDFGGTTVTISAHVGAYGAEYKFTPDGIKIGWASVVGGSISIS